MKEVSIRPKNVKFEVEKIYNILNKIKGQFLSYAFFSLVLRCPTLFSNLNFTDCAPYPGQSCDFKCKAGYRRAVDDTVYCDRIGQWSSPTETLCKGLFKQNIKNHQGVINKLKIATVIETST